MILEIDAGNTFVKWRLINKKGVVSRGRVKALMLNEGVPESWLEGVVKVRVSSVAGDHVNGLINTALKSIDVSIAYAYSSKACAGVVNAYVDPVRLGVDRWLAMLAAYNQCHKMCCIVDCGSAITVDYVDAEGFHQGGFIMPGLRLMQQGLLSNTAEIIVDHDCRQFDIEPGCHTSSAVSHGINYMFMSLAEKVSSEVKESGGELFVTGGDGKLFAGLVAESRYDPDLVLDGLKWSVPE